MNEPTEEQSVLYVCENDQSVLDQLYIKQGKEYVTLASLVKGKPLQEDQEALPENQEALPENQEALPENQEALPENQETLLEPFEQKPKRCCIRIGGIRVCRRVPHSTDCSSQRF